MRFRLPLRAALCAVVAAVLAALIAGTARADADSATRYYLSLGDSLAASLQPNGDVGHGYAEQLYAMLATDDLKLELVKLGCGGESTASMRFGSQLPSVVLSCGTPRYYKHLLYPKGTQLAEAVSFLEAHKGKVALVTIDIGVPAVTTVEFAWLLRDLGREVELLPTLQSAPATPWIEAAEAVARGDVDRAAEIVAHIGAPAVEAYTRLRAGEELVAADRHTEAVPQLEKALDFYRSVGATRYVREAEALMPARVQSNLGSSAKG